MASPSSSSVKEVDLTAFRPSLPFPPVHYHCKAWWTCWRKKAAGTRIERCDCLLATGHDYSVIPRYIQKRLDLVVTAEPGWLGDVPSWFASACSIGRVEMHLPVQPSLGVPHWRFSLLVLLPDKRLRRDPPLVLLGAQFLEEFQARVRLEPAGGKLLIP